MYRVFSCLTGEHDWRLVVLAGFVCLLASLVAVSVVRRARAARGRARAAWLALAGAAAGCGIWATHFIAMLAYEPGVQVAYDIELTGLSLLAAAAVTFVGLGVAVNGRARFAPALGGGIVGAGIACMHYTGMWALELPGRVTWSLDLVLVSITLGLVLGAAALTVAMRRESTRTELVAAVLLTLAIVSHHFTAMGAVEIIPDPTRAFENTSLSETSLALTIAGAAIMGLVLSLFGAIADSYSAARTIQFERTRQQLIKQTEEMLREQHHRLDTALNNMGHGLCMFDNDARLLLCNQRYIEMYGLPPAVATSRCTIQELIALHYTTGIFSSIGDIDKYIEEILSGIAAGNTVSKIVELSDHRVVAIINSPIPGGGRVSTHEDITERHRLYQAHAQAEVQLREQKLQLDTAVENMTQGLCMFDTSARVMVCNRRFVEMYNLSPAVVKPGCTLQDLLKHRKDVGLLDADPEQFRRDILESVAQGKTTTFVVQATDGRFIRSLNQPMPGGGWVTTHEDITEQRQAENQVRDQKHQLDVALNNMTQGLVLFDSQTRLILCNQRYMQMYGLSADTVKPGCLLQELLELRKAKGMFARDPARYVAKLKATLDQGESATLITEMLDGRVIAVANQPMSGGGWVSTHEDITEQRNAETKLRMQKLQLDTALNNMTQGLNMFDADGHLVVCNERYREMYRLPPEAVQPGCTVRDLVDARIAAGTFFAMDPEKYAADLRAAMDKRAPGSTTMELIDGRVIAVFSQPTPDDSGWVVTHEDITERRRVEKERDRSQAFASTVIENVPTTIVVKDAHTLRYVLVNRAGEEYFGISRNMMIGKTSEEVFSPETAEMIAQHDQELLQTGETKFYDEHPVTTPGTGNRIITTTRMPIRDQMGDTQYLLTVIEDRTNRKRAEAQIAHMAHHDKLTGLPNRAAYTECLDLTVQAAAKDGSSFALMCLDIDRFKSVNDVFGHAVGDALLCEISRRMQATAGGAFLACLGGDEFTVIATDGEQPAAAEDLAERLIAAVAEEFIIDGQQLRSGLSIGISIFPVDGADTTTLVANVDAALYRAKAEGRGSYRFFEAGMDKRLRERRALQHELRSAIERSELALHFQPQARIGGEVTGFEALVRWRHPTHGMIPPGTFIPLAEESGLIISMGEWIMREACRQAASWPKPLHIAINLSPVQFSHGDLPGLVHSVLLETGLAPDRLELEITEGVLIGDFSRAVSILRRLKALGVRIAMDDFGTGYSSLSYLQSFPFDKIKIDQAFISNLERNPQSATIIRAVIGLARGLELPVLAEGVETKEQLAFLAKESCDEVQGYLIGRPLPIEEYAALTGQPVKKTKVGAAAS